MKKQASSFDENLADTKRHVGVRKEIDGLGRIVVPKEMRSLYNINSEVELVVTQFGILMRAPGYKLVEVDEDANP